ncbi:MAG: hypothetical protein ACRCSB_05680 [Bacteroidales bacterium]
MQKLFFILLLVVAALPIQAQSHSSKSLGGFMPDVMVERAMTTNPTARDGRVSIPNLRAVVITGDIDGAYGEDTQEYVKWTKETADVLRANGVKVSEFYCPNNDWNKIKQAANGAHFLVYQGHGILLSDSPFEIGGFWLKDDVVRPEQIKSDLKLAPNAVILMGGVCYAAGTSASDGSKDIGMKEAQKRVAMYSKPFMDIGASAYIANNWHGGLAKVTASLFAGKKLSDAYYAGYANNPTQTAYPTQSGMNLWVTKHEKSYLNAFAGKSDKGLADLFSGAIISPNASLSDNTTPSTTTTVSSTSSDFDSPKPQSPTKTNKEYFVSSTYTFMNMDLQKALEVPKSTFSEAASTASLASAAMTGEANQKWKLLPVPNQVGQFAFLISMNNVRYALKSEGNTLKAIRYNSFKDVQEQAGMKFTIMRVPNQSSGWLILSEDGQCLKMQGSSVTLSAYNESSLSNLQIWDIAVF